MTIISDGVSAPHSPPAEAGIPAVRDVADRRGGEGADATAPSTAFVVLGSDDNAGVCGPDGVCS